MKSEMKSSWLVSSSFFASFIDLTKASSVLWSASTAMTSGTDTSRTTFMPPFRSRPRPISISRHCFRE